MRLRASISADVLGRTAELRFQYPAEFNLREVSFLFQDASESATGGDILTPSAGSLMPATQNLFLAQFNSALLSNLKPAARTMAVWHYVVHTGH